MDPSLHLERKDLLLLIPATFLALAGLGPEDPWILVPCLALSWLSFLAICWFHNGRRKWRVLIAIGITVVLLFVGSRRLHLGIAESPTAATPKPMVPTPHSVAPMLPSLVSSPKSASPSQEAPVSALAIAIRARNLSVEMQAFFISATPPNPFQEPSENGAYGRAWNKFVADTLAEFGHRFGERLFALTSDLKVLSLADVHLDLDISMMGLPPSGLPNDIPVRLAYIADHLENEEERAILRVPLRRRLTPKDTKKFKASLLPPTGKLLVGYSQEEADAKDYAADLDRKSVV